MKVIKLSTIIITLLLLWQLLIWLGHLPAYILPSPLRVAITLYHQLPLIAYQALFTISEVILGLLCGIAAGMIAALILVYCRPARWWFLPIVIISQALPVFAIAPLFVIWFGYGMASKVAITMLMLFFPVTSSFYDGLCRVPKHYLELATLAQASRWQTLRYIQMPAALPALASGIRVAATYAPMGAVIGEWVGASRGLGFLMLNANARMEIDLVFAVLITIMLLTLLLYFTLDYLLKRWIWWQHY